MSDLTISSLHLILKPVQRQIPVIPVGVNNAINCIMDESDHRVAGETEHDSKIIDNFENAIVINQSISFPC